MAKSINPSAAKPALNPPEKPLPAIEAETTPAAEEQPPVKRHPINRHRDYM